MRFRHPHDRSAGREAVSPSPGEAPRIQVRLISDSGSPGKRQRPAPEAPDARATPAVRPGCQIGDFIRKIGHEMKKDRDKRTAATVVEDPGEYDGQRNDLRHEEPEPWRPSTLTIVVISMLRNGPRVML